MPNFQPTAEPQTANGLPGFCFSTLPSSGELIVIERGVAGYREVALEDVQGYMALYPCDSERELADLLNARDGVTKAEREAMMWGSMFGWETPLADPHRYNADGHPIKVRTAAEVRHA
jgi:hypothetical protein